MRLLQFATTSDAGRRHHLGALVDGSADEGTVVDVAAAVRSMLEHDGVSRAGIAALGPALGPDGMLEFIEGGAATRDAAERALEHVATSGAERDPSGARLHYDAATLELLPAITGPPMLRDFMAFEQHLLNVFPRLGREIPPEWYERPVYYKANTGSLGAHRQSIGFPGYAQRLDFEFEFAAILGRDGTNIREDRAGAHIFGYTIYNDLSAREIQQREMTVGLGPAKGKDFHGAHVLGPVVVTADEFADPYALAMTGTVNDAIWTTGSSADMHWRFEQMIAYASSYEPLRAGEVFGSGTVGGGSGAEQDRWLEPGDVVSLTVAGLGTLTNRVIAAAENVAASWEHR
jgi:2-keto-4-pentenoate hydratase/2-oxohepta-3-ene-1,7-dioic acid hydratase in catechol pathway